MIRQDALRWISGVAWEGGLPAHLGWTCAYLAELPYGVQPNQHLRVDESHGDILRSILAHKPQSPTRRLLIEKLAGS